MPEPDSLDTYLRSLRAAAGLSLEEVCQATKIQARFVRALEEGRYGEVPSNTHLRAFGVAVARACGGDPKEAGEWVGRALKAAAPPVPVKGFDTPALPPRREAAPAASPAPTPASPAPGGTYGGLETAAPSGFVAASVRLRSLPLPALLGLLALAGTLSYAAAWGTEQWRHRLDLAALGAADQSTGPAAAEAPSAPAAAGAGVAGTAPGGAAAGGEGSSAEARDSAGAASLAAAPSAEAAPAELLTLRARRACWLVLQIDGKRLPTVTLSNGDKFNWSVHERAVLLAGNLGALRVWWRGDNLGYLGELGQRANAVVFERGHAPRLDRSAALKLPRGVPE